MLIHSSLVLNVCRRAADGIEKPISQRSAKVRRYSCTVDDIRRIADDIQRLNGLFVILTCALDSREDPTKYMHHTTSDFLQRCKLQLPDKLSLLPAEAQEDAQ
jgi:hypothetical protein